MAATNHEADPLGSASFTAGFLLASEFTINEANTLATLLAESKIRGVSWRSILNNTTSTRQKRLGGPTCDPLAGLIKHHQIGDQTSNYACLLSSESVGVNEIAERLLELPDEWWCASLTLPHSFSKGDQQVLKVAAAAATVNESM